MKIEDIIKNLKKSDLWAEHPKCGGEFKLSDAILFDGTKPFPKEALDAQQMFAERLKERKKELEKKKKNLKEKASHTKSVNVGQLLEKVLPTLKDFKWELSDCRFMGKPIDLIAFNGLSLNRIKSISFIEVKTGNAQLKKNQKSIRDAIEDKNVSYKVIR